MMPLKETLIENGFLKIEEDSDTSYSNVFDLCSELALTVNECYFFSKNSDDLEYKSFMVCFMADLSDELAFPMNHAKLPEIIVFINEEFSKYGEIDTSQLDQDGSFSIEREEPLLSLDKEFLSSVDKYRTLLLREFDLVIKKD